MEQVAAALHQDHHVAGPDRAALAGQRPARRQPVADRRRDPGREHLDGIVRGAGVDRLVPGALVGPVGLAEERPELDPAGLVGVDRVVGDRPQPLAGRAGEDPVDELEHRPGGAERVEQVAALQLGAELGQHLLVVRALGAELGRVGALEAVDRLLLVADDEDRPGDLAGAGAGEELLRQRLDHPPLRRAGVLRLVDQDVVEPAVEPPEHPGGGARMLEQRARPVDQVVEVEQPEVALGAVVGREPGPPEAVERRGLREGGVGEPERPRRLGQPRHQRVERRHQARRGRCGSPWSGTARTSAAKGASRLSRRAAPLPGARGAPSGRPRPAPRRCTAPPCRRLPLRSIRSGTSPRRCASADGAQHLRRRAPRA